MPTPSPSLRIAITTTFFVAVLALIYYESRQAKREIPAFGAIPPFSLTTSSSTPFTERDLRGQVSIADFVFTTCAGPCPLMSAKMQHLQHAFPSRPDIKLLSFTVDPVEDTPDVLREYAGRFEADSTRWTFLTGDKAEMYALIQKGFLLSVDADSDAILHSTKFVLIDKSARIRGYYDSEDDSTMSALVDDAIAIAGE